MGADSSPTRARRPDGARSPSTLAAAVLALGPITGGLRQPREPPPRAAENTRRRADERAPSKRRERLSRIDPGLSATRHHHSWIARGRRAVHDCFTERGGPAVSDRNRHRGVGVRRRRGLAGRPARRESLTTLNVPALEQPRAAGRMTSEAGRRRFRRDISAIFGGVVPATTPSARGVARTAERRTEGPANARRRLPVGSRRRGAGEVARQKAAAAGGHYYGRRSSPSPVVVSAAWFFLLLSHRQG